MLHFLNPALAFGALLFAVPLIIHLLNRQRYRKRPWAAMEFLLAAYKKQRNRLRTENLLLLLLRCLIPIALAFAIARPTLRDSAMSSLLGGSCHHVIVVDGSYSMGLLAQGVPSPWERSKTLGSQLLERVEGKQGHKVSIAVSGVRPSWPVMDELSIPRARATLAALRGPLDASTDLLPVLRQTADFLERGSDPEYRIYLFTDLQRRAFGKLESARPKGPTPPEQPRAESRPGNDENLFADSARDLCDRIQKKAELVILDTAGALEAGTAEGNLQIAALTMGQAHAAAKVPFPIVATVKNRGAQKRSSQVTLEIDGAEPMRKTCTLDPGGETQVEFVVTLREVGPRRLRASLEPDPLPADNERFLVVHARDRLKVVLVEGSTEIEATLRESNLVRRILDPTLGSGTPDLTLYETTVIDALTFLANPAKIGTPDLVVLCNVERINESAGQALRDRLQAGSGLLLMLGSRCDAESYNLHLHQDGKGPLPLRLTSARGYPLNGEEYYGFTVPAPQHPLFADLTQDVYKDMFRLTPIYKFVGSEARDLPTTAEVLARVSDPERSVLAIANTYGAGKTLVFTSPIAGVPLRWNMLNDLWFAFPVVRQAAQWLCVPAVDPYNVAVGAPLSVVLTERPASVAIVLSERADSQKVLVGGDPQALPGGRFAMPPFHRTEFAGHYVADLELGSSGAARRQQVPFAVNVDPEEGELSWLSAEAVKDGLAVTKVLRGLPEEGKAVVASGSSELGPFLLYLVLFFVLGEAALARLVSQRRS